jgi:hypothetical protein
LSPSQAPIPLDQSRPVVKGADMNPNAKWQFAAFFIFCAVCGALFIYTHWGEDNLSLAVGRTALFVLVLAAVHLGGFALYARQFQSATAPVAPPTRTVAEDGSPAFLRVVLIQQIPILVLASLMLDGGGTFRRYCVVAIAHWAVIGVVLMRRRRTRIDMVIVRWGFFPIAILVGLMARLIIR